MHPPIDLQSQEKRWLLAVLPLTTYPGMRYAYQKYSFVGQRKSSCALSSVHSWEKLVWTCILMVVFGSCFIDTLKVMNNTMSN
jgi:hypothetical protein